MNEDWIIIPNWDRFQHYTDRVPVWLKLYLELRDKDEWRALTFAERGLLVSIWMEIGASKGAVRCTYLAKNLGHRVKIDALDSLLSAGFIQLSASKPLAASRALAREEKRREKPRVRATPKTKPAEPRTNAGAYQPFNDTPPATVDVDPAVLELARKWISR